VKKKIIAFFLIFISLSYGTYIFIPPVVAKYHSSKSLKQLNLEVKKLKYDEDFFEYLEGGTGETLVFVHGFQSTKNTWVPYFKKFANNYHIVAMDLPGHGGSSRPKMQKYDLQSMAKSLAIFIDKKNLNNVHLIGTSMGGGLVTIYSYQHPEKVKSLILINPLGVDQKKKSELQKLLDRGRNVFFPDNLTEFDEMTIYLTGKQSKLSSYFKKYFLNQMMKKYVFFKKAFKELLEKTQSLDDILPKISTPTLILISQNDKIIHPESYEYFVKLMPNAQSIRFEKGSHVLVDIYFDQAIKAMNEFLRNNQNKRHISNQ
jgi:abhydrolase domain-containing protein 6